MAQFIKVSLFIIYIKIIYLSNFVPISLLMTFEMIKFIQATFIEWDIDMVDKKTGFSASV